MAKRNAAQRFFSFYSSYKLFIFRMSNTQYWNNRHKNATITLAHTIQCGLYTEERGKKRASMKINFHPSAERKTLESGRSQRRDYNFQFDHDWIGLNSIQYSWHNQSNVTDRILISESNRVNANDTLWLLFDRVCAREKKTIRPIVNKMKWF